MSMQQHRIDGSIVGELLLPEAIAPDFWQVGICLVESDGPYITVRGENGMIERVDTTEHMTESPIGGQEVVDTVEVAGIVNEAIEHAYSEL